MKTRQKLYVAIGLFLMFGIGFFPPVLGLPPLGMKVAGIFSGTIWMFVLVDTTWTAFLPIIALSIFQIYPYTDVIRMSIGSWVFSFVLTASMLCYALSKCGILRRIAVVLITRPILRAHPWLLVSAMLLMPLIIGSFSSVIPTFLVCTSICEEVLAQAGYDKGSRTAEILMMGILIFTCAAEGMSPIAHTVPVLALSIYSENVGDSITFIEYILTNVWFVIVLFIIFLLLAKMLYKIDLSGFEDVDMDRFTETLEPAGKREIFTTVIFLGVVILWILPGIVDFPYLETLGVTIPAMAGVVLLCVLRIEGAPLMDFVDSIKNGVAWKGQVMVCVSVMLGNVLMIPEAGIRELLSDVFARVMDKVPAFCMVIIMTAFIILMTNFMSDSVTITVVSAVMMPVVLSGAAGIIDAKIFTVLMGFTGSLAFATPAACANAAILSGSGWVRHSEQFKMGSLMAVTAILAVSIMTIPVIKALFV